MKKNKATEQTKKYLSSFPSQNVLPDIEQRELVRQWVESKDQKALDKLIYSNRKMVVKQAYRYSNSFTDIEDLIQYGMMGLIKATEKFDPTREIKFMSYAVYWINSEILSALKKESVNSFKSKEKNLSSYPQCESPDNELSCSTNIEQDIIDRDYKQKETEEIKKSYDVLTPKERYIIDKYYFQNPGYKNVSCEQVGDIIGCSKQRIAVIIKDGVSKLKTKINSRDNKKEFLID